MSHSESMTKNIESFKKDAEFYDSIPAMQVLTDLFTLSMLNFPSREKTDHEVLTAETISAQLHAAHQKFNPEKVNLDAKNSGSGSRNGLFREDATIVDFACGTGLVASKIAPYVSKGRIVGVDISEAMLSVFDAKAQRIMDQYPSLDVSSVRGDVLSPDFDMEPLTGIADVLVCTLAFHHLHDYNHVAAKMKQMLKPGGWIFVYDFYNEDQEKPPGEHHIDSGVSHHGVTLDEMKAALADGCKNVSSSREFRVDVWHELPFIMSHCCEEVRNNLATAERRGDLYLVKTSIILGVAQKC